MIRLLLLGSTDSSVLIARVLCLLVIVWTGALGIHRIFFSRLSMIPGPWYTAVSDLWILFWGARFKQNSAVHDLFRRYGPIVRAGPRRVILCDLEAVRTAYCIRKLDKSRFYKALLVDGHDHSITAVTETEHKARRKTYSSHYALHEISQFQLRINSCVAKLVEVGCLYMPASIECMHLLRHVFADIVRVTVLGTSPVAVDCWQSAVPDPLCSAVRDFPNWAILHSLLHPLFWKTTGYIPVPRWQKLYSSHDVLVSIVRERLTQLRRDAQSNSITTFDGPEPLMLSMIRRAMSSHTEYLSDNDVVAECTSHLVGGMETSTTTLSFMLWKLSQRTDIVIKLRNELEKLGCSQRSIPHHADLMKRPYLNAFLNEGILITAAVYSSGLRIYGGVSSLLERVVPHQTTCGKKLDELELMGFLLPPGTIVGTQAWSMHRNAEVFPCPDEFDPDRWLPSGDDDHEKERIARMTRYLMPFGAGSRACPGRYQAQMVFRILLATLVLNFDIVADPSETNAKTMALRDAFATRPASEECCLRFVPRCP
ncbi:cytochrome P450 [Daedaleopsis nitida]|nr:cytochrome P450 [Daedaleopsis nitida]